MGRRLVLWILLIGFLGYLFGWTVVGDFAGAFVHGAITALRAFAHALKEGTT